MDKIMDKFYLSNSGNPLIDISSDNTPASTAVPATVIQSASGIVTAAGIIASADCATVFNALIPARFPRQSGAQTLYAPV